MPQDLLPFPVVVALPVAFVGILVDPYRIGLLAQQRFDALNASFQITAPTIFL